MTRLQLREAQVVESLRQRGMQVAYACEPHLWACDFVTPSAVIQVCSELTAFNREREVQGVLRALDLPGKRHPLILTLDQRDRLHVDGVTVDVLPASEWMS